MALEIELFARDRGGLANQRDVAAFMQGLLGAKGANRREMLRKALRNVEREIRSIDEKWDDDPVPAHESAVSELSRLLSNRWQALASLSRSSRMRRSFTLAATVLLLTTAYALGARREPAIAESAAIARTAAPRPETSATPQ